MARKKQTETRVGAKVTPERKEKVKTSQADRRKRLTDAAKKAGFDTIDKLAAYINGMDCEKVAIVPVEQNQL